MSDWQMSSAMATKDDHRSWQVRCQLASAILGVFEARLAQTWLIFMLMTLLLALKQWLLADTLHAATTPFPWFCRCMLPLTLPLFL